MQESNKKVHLSWGKSKTKTDLVSLPSILAIALLPAVLMLTVFLTTSLPIIWEKLKERRQLGYSQRELVSRLRTQGTLVEAHVFRGIPNASEDNTPRVRKRERRSAVSVSFCWRDETLLYTFLQASPRELVQKAEERQILLRCAACLDSSCYLIVANPQDHYSTHWWKWSLPLNCLYELPAE